MYHREVQQNQMPVEGIIDKDELLERVDQDYDLLEELHPVFVADISEQISELENALSRRDLKAVQTTAHSLKGALGNLSAKEAFALASRTEKAASEGAISTVEALYPELKKQASLAMEALEHILHRSRF